jgi:hypothetical protein
MQFPSDLSLEIQARIDRALKSHPGALSADRKALLVEGSFGHGCYVSPDGDIFMETYDVGSDEPSTFDRSRRAQISCLKLGSRTLPQLAELLPPRPSDAPTCLTCGGSGWLLQELFEKQSAGDGVLCHDCCGLGWLGAF